MTANRPDWGEPKEEGVASWQSPDVTRVVNFIFQKCVKNTKFYLQSFGYKGFSIKLLIARNGSGRFNYAVSECFLNLRKARVWRGQTLALKDLSLEIECGEKIAILGPNGAGKSSLLKLLTGEVRIENRMNSQATIFGDDCWALDELRERVGIVMPEDIARFENEELAGDVVLSTFRGSYGRACGMRFSKMEKEAAHKAMEALGVTKLRKRLFGTLSSGEKRRFLIARAWALRSEVLVLDEPTTALDFPGSLALLAQLADLISEGRTGVMVTHHPGEILPEIGRVILLKDGEIVADGQKRDVVTSRKLSELFELPCHVRWSSGWCDVSLA